MDMDIDLPAAVAPANGRNRSAADPDWRFEEELRGKVHKSNSREDESCEDISDEIREILHQGHRMLLRSAAIRARAAKNMERLARRYPEATFLLKGLKRSH